MKVYVYLAFVITFAIQGCVNNRIPSALSSNLFLDFPPKLGRNEFGKTVINKNALSELQGYVIPFRGNIQLSENLEKSLFLDNYFLKNAFFRASDRELVKAQFTFLSKLPQYAIDMSDLHRKILGVGQISWNQDHKYEKLRDSVNQSMNQLIRCLKLKYDPKYDFSEYEAVNRKRKLIESREVEISMLKNSNNYRNNSRIRVESDLGVLLGPSKGGVNISIDTKYKIYSGDYLGVKVGRMYVVNEFNSNQTLKYFAFTFEHIPRSNLATNRFNNFHYWGFGLGLFESNIIMNRYTNIYNRNTFEAQRDFIPGVFIRNGTQIGPLRLGYAFYGLPKIEFSKPGGAVLGINNVLFNFNIGCNIGGSLWQ